MTRNRLVLVMIGLCRGLLVSGRFVSRAQDPDTAVRKDAPDAVPQQAAVEDPRPPQLAAPGGPHCGGNGGALAAGSGSLQDALLRPYPFPFSRPTPLFQVAHLKQTLGGAVVLDLAALDRQDVDPDDPVELDLDGVRLEDGSEAAA